MKIYKTISVLAAVIFTAAAAAWPASGSVLRPQSALERKEKAVFKFGETIVLHGGAMRIALVTFRRITKGEDRFAQGWVVVMQPDYFDMHVDVDDNMVKYDFYTSAITEGMAEARSRQTGRRIEFELLPGKTVPKFAVLMEEDTGEAPDFVTAATQGGFWGNNTFVIIKGQLIKKEIEEEGEIKPVPGLYVDPNATDEDLKLKPANGDYFFFVFDEGKVGIRVVTMKDGEPVSDISDIGLAISGPPLLLPNPDGAGEPIDVSSMIEYLKKQVGDKQISLPLVGPYQTNWDLSTTITAFSGWSRGPHGEVIYMGLGGDPADHPAIPDDIREELRKYPIRLQGYFKENDLACGILCAELVGLARQIGATALLLGPGSVDVNACAKGVDKRLISKPTAHSETADFYEKLGGRPVGTHFWAKARQARAAAGRALTGLGGMERQTAIVIGQI